MIPQIEISIVGDDTSSIEYKIEAVQGPGWDHRRPSSDNRL